MAQYSDLIAGLTVGNYGNGNGTLAGFTQLWNPTSTNRLYEVTTDASAPSGKKLTCTISTANTRTLLGINAVSADAARGTCEIIALVRSNYLPTGSAGISHGFAFNGSGAATTETAQSFGLGRNGTSHCLRRQPYTAGAAGSATNSVASINSITGGTTPTPFWIQVLLTPTAWTMRAYAQNNLDGTVVASANGSHSNADGVIGLFSFFTGFMDYLYVSVGTGADSAPRPSGSAPTGTVTITGVTPTHTTASVAWNYSASDQTGFEYRLNGGSAVSAGTSSPFVITGLSPSTAYTVEVRAVNGGGAGAWSAVSNFTTNAAPAVPPTGTVTIGSITPSNTSAIVPFTYSASDQTGFEYRLNGGAATSAGTSSPLNLSGLTASTAYTIEMRAINSAGSGSWSAVSNFTTTAAVAAMQLDTTADLVNASAVLSTITNATTTTPTAFIVPRAATNTFSPIGQWRNLVARFTGCAGKQPIFRLDRATHEVPSALRSNNFRICWTADFVTFNQFPVADVSSGTTGYYQVQHTAPFTSDAIYVLWNPMLPASVVGSRLAALVAAQPSHITAAPSAVAYKAANPSAPDNVCFVQPSILYPTESGEPMSGQQIGFQPVYAIKMDWGTSQGGTTDGGLKRKAVLMQGQHAQGEQQAAVSFLGALEWLASSTEATALRRNFVFYVYANINGSGIKGGHKRLGFESVNDYNREWLKGSPLATVAATRNAIASDTGGSANILLDWHSTADNRGDYTSIESDTYGLANNSTWNTLAASYFDMANADISTVDSTTGYVINWAYTTLGTDYATHAEHANRGNNSAANLESVGRAWLRTLQAADAGGMFYTATGTPFDDNLSKVSIPVSSKTLSISFGFNDQLVKSSLTPTFKELTIDSGSSVPFVSNINKGSISVTMKSADFVGGVSANTSKSFVVLSGKQLTLSSGTSIPFDSDMIKYTVPVLYKTLDLDTGTAVSFDGYVIKRNIHLSSKFPSLSVGSSLDVEVNTYIFGYKTLMMAQSVFYPIDVSRVYEIDGNKIKSFFIK